jgi:hypothetical protein
MRNSRTRSRWSPWSMIRPFLLVPPHAQYVLSFCAMLGKSEFLSSMPSIMVVDLPNFLVSRRMRILCCSFSISPQTHRSLGSPHVEQTSAMTLNSELSTDVYKSFKLEACLGWVGGFCFVIWLVLVSVWCAVAGFLRVKKFYSPLI